MNYIGPATAEELWSNFETSMMCAAGLLTSKEKLNSLHKVDWMVLKGFKKAFDQMHVLFIELVNENVVLKDAIEYQDVVEGLYKYFGAEEPQEKKKETPRLRSKKGPGRPRKVDKIARVKK